VNLTAKIKHVTGVTKHYLGTIENGAPEPVKELPPPAYVEIQEAESGFFLLYFDSEGNCMTDTWHPTLEDAKEQAKAEFEIDEEDWVKPLH
jgi:hypothetical protein